MAEYNRFVSYIYFYKNKERMANVGFVKVLASDKTVKLNVKVSGVSSTNPLFKVKFLLNDGSRLPLGETNLRGSTITFYGEYDIDNIEDSSKSFKESAGLIIENTDDDALFASVWIEHEDEQCIFARQSFVVDNSYTKEVKEEDKQELKTEDEAYEIKEQDIHTEFEEDGNEELYEEKHLPKIGIFEEYENCDFVDAFNDDEFYDCIDIGPDVLNKLPEHMRGIRNNSFLMHGYVQYHHLLLARVEGNENAFFIGVPGVLTKSENAMAAMYGFTKFKSSHRSDVHICGFGYWYFIVK